MPSPTHATSSDDSTFPELAVLLPTLRTGVETFVVAARAWLSTSERAA